MLIDILIVSVVTTVSVATTSKVFRSNCPFVNLKSQANTADKGVVLL